MKKIILTSLLVSGAMLVGTQMTSAEEVKNSETPIGIEFKTEDDTELVDGPYDNVLTLVYKPAAFDFGSQKATGNAQIYPGVKPETSQYLIVNDDRETGNAAAEKGAKWTLSAKMNDLTSGSEKLAASLNMTLSPVKEYTMGNQKDEAGRTVPNKPNDQSITDFAEDYTHNVEIHPVVNIEAGSNSETVLMSKTAKTDDNFGVATEVTGTSLNIKAPKSVAGKQFTSKIVWTLSTDL